MKSRGLFGLDSITLVLVGALLIAGLGYFWFQKRALTDALKARDVAILQRDTVAGERDKAILIAKQNEATITALQAEKENLNTALNQLEASRVQASTGRTSREVIIQAQASNTASRAITPPVISDVIASIQADRQERRP